ncbi:unnamed protein product [Prunus armeniaca]
MPLCYSAHCRHTRWQHVGVQSDTDCRKTSKSRATFPAIATIRRVEQLIQLRQHPISTRNPAKT